jgi:predicted DNA-binding transcriptional regulator YafY
VEELMERLPAYSFDWRDGSEKVRASVRRKFERDKNELRDMGIPLETVTYSINFGREELQGYKIDKKDLYLPYLKLLQRGTPRPGAAPPEMLADADLFSLTPDGSMEIQGELAADAIWGLKELADLPGFPMAPSARSAYRKFTFDLDPEMVRGGGPDELSGAPLGQKHVHFAIPPETARAEEYLEILSDALLRRKRVTFSYHGIERNTVTEREVRPYGLLFKHSHWYLVGWDETRDAERIFRVDRMENVQVNAATPATPDYEMPTEPVLERYRDREAWELGEADDVVEALVRFRFPASLWAARNGYGEQVDQGDDGSTLRRFQVRQPDPFIRWILSQEGEAEIEDPPALREGLRAMAKQVADLYREDADA